MQEAKLLPDAFECHSTTPPLVNITTKSNILATLPIRRHFQQQRTLLALHLHQIKSCHTFHVTCLAMAARSIATRVIDIESCHF